MFGGLVVTSAGVGAAFSLDSFIDDLKGEFELPTIVYTPYMIFSNKIPLFDINFFNPMDDINENITLNGKLGTWDNALENVDVNDRVIVDYENYKRRGVSSHTGDVYYYAPYDTLEKEHGYILKLDYYDHSGNRSNYYREQELFSLSEDVHNAWDVYINDLLSNSNYSTDYLNALNDFNSNDYPTPHGSIAGRSGTEWEFRINGNIQPGILASGKSNGWIFDDNANDDSNPVFKTDCVTCAAFAACCANYGELISVKRDFEYSWIWLYRCNKYGVNMGDDPSDPYLKYGKYGDGLTRFNEYGINNSPTNELFSITSGYVEIYEEYLISYNGTTRDNFKLNDCNVYEVTRSRYWCPLDEGISQIGTVAKLDSYDGYSKSDNFGDDFSTNWYYTLEYDEETKAMTLNKTSKELLSREAINFVSAAGILRSPVSSMYKTFQLIAIVFLLSMLVYVGIRMALTSVASDKVKYKKMLLDWFIALALVFVLHYIMAFIMNISSKLTTLFEESSIENVLLQIPNGTKVNVDGTELLLDQSTDNVDLWATNFIGVIRFYAGLVQYTGYTVKGIGYTIMYCVMVAYMVIYTFMYLKRVFYMAFLTMVAPLVAITYPFEKIEDGKAKGFTLWLKEYVLTAMLQVIHCLAYVTIFGSVMQMVVDFPVYGLIGLAFLFPVERLLRNIFGLNSESIFESKGRSKVFGGMKRMGREFRSMARRMDRLINNNEKRRKLNNSNQNRNIRMIDNRPSMNAESPFPEFEGDNQPNEDRQWEKEDWDRDSKGRWYDPYTEEWKTEEELLSGK